MFTLNCKGRILTIDKPIVMGIINITPDSFFEGSRHTEIDSILKQAEQMLADGATILDIGGQSTRPGSIKISAEEELKRVLVHGLLHYCGYKDKTDDDEKIMRLKEDEKIKLFHVKQ